MGRDHLFPALAALLIAQCALSQDSSPVDWPGWRGPDRSGRSAETGLLDRWPESGPPLVWRTEGLGGGFGSLAVAGVASGRRVFLQMRVGEQSAVAALDAADGRLVWSRALGPGRDNDRGPGPRGTPTVDGDRVYALTEAGDLAALSASDGALLWAATSSRISAGETSTGSSANRRWSTATAYTSLRAVAAPASSPSTK